MHLPLGRPGTWWLASVLCALAAAYLLAPAPARAACGEYVTIVGQPGNAGHSTSPDSLPPMSGPRDGHKPCTGPNCSADTPAAPVVPGIPTTPPPVEDIGMVSGADAARSDSPPARRWDDLTRLRSTRFSSGVYHPPR